MSPPWEGARSANTSTSGAGAVGAIGEGDREIGWTVRNTEPRGSTSLPSKPAGIASRIDGGIFLEEFLFF